MGVDPCGGGPEGRKTLAIVAIAAGVVLALGKLIPEVDLLEVGVVYVHFAERIEHLFAVEGVLDLDGLLFG